MSHTYLIRVAVVLTVLTSLFAAGSPGPTIAESVGTTGATFMFAPTNDNFANAQPILGASGIIFGSNVGATKEANEPNHAGDAGGASVWYKWQAPSNRRVTFTTYRSNFNTLLAVYSGDTLPGVPVASDDNAGQIFGSPCNDRTSRVSFNAIGGVVYRIAVDRNSTDVAGNIVLRWGISATISGSIKTSSNLSPVRLEGDICRDTESFGSIFFTDIPTGGSYSVVVRASGATFKRWGTTESISPLVGDVSNYNYYQDTPAANIVIDNITIPGGDQTGLTVMCVGSPSTFISATGFSLGGGRYQCSALPIFTNYVVTPTKPGVNFSPVNRTIFLGNSDFFSLGFTGTEAPKYTISGRVTNSSGTGVNGVSLVLSGSLTASTATDANGNYFFPGILQGGNYTVTASNANFTFAPPSQSLNNVTANQTANFTATFLLQLLLDESGQVAALDSMLGVRDPFPVINEPSLLNRGVDRNTRVTIFVANFALAAGELPSSVVLNLIGSNNQTYDIPAEDVRPLVGSTFTQITFRLPDSLSVGTCTLAVKAHGLTSNLGSMRIRN